MSRAFLPSYTIHDDPETIRRQLLGENPQLASILAEARTIQDVRAGLRAWMEEALEHSPEARTFYKSPMVRRLLCESLKWREVAAIRILDYLDHSGRTFTDPNDRDEQIVTRPFSVLFDSTRGWEGGASAAFWLDMLQLFRQLNGTLKRSLPEPDLVARWMVRHPSGLERPVVELRRRNRDRILRVIQRWIEGGEIVPGRYRLEEGLPARRKKQRMLEWWNDHRFHLQFAARNPEHLNELLGGSLSEETMTILRAAREKGIPFFINPYYLTLINVDEPEELRNTDLAVRDYILYSRQLVEEFGNITPWENEGEFETGRPTAAGWVLPDRRNVRRRYPDVAILVPETTGEKCGGLCSSCQRMYDIQQVSLNLGKDRRAAREPWPDKLDRLLRYWETDTQLRDILIAGGDALMNSNEELERIFDALCRLAERKQAANRDRRDGEKYAELQRVRLGTRLPVFLPQRITDSLLRVLSAFRTRASALGVNQFIIQTHFDSAMEITPEVRRAIRKLIATGWIVTNQQVFTTAASRRGHTARLRQVLNDIGVLPYYTFAVKGFKENQHNFSTAARLVQEQVEEKYIGLVPHIYTPRIQALLYRALTMIRAIKDLRQSAGVPFLPTDRNVLDMPTVGKSSTYRCIGIAPDGRRILQFDHDPTRRHSPILEQIGKVDLVESKSVGAYLDQVAGMGDDPSEFNTIWGYSVGATEPLAPLYEYPGFNFRTTPRFSNLRLPARAEASSVADAS